MSSCYDGKPSSLFIGNSKFTWSFLKPMVSSNIVMFRILKLNLLNCMRSVHYVINSVF
jgi:hypothetical protein